MSGITFKVDTSIDSTVVVDDNEVFVKLGDQQRVYDIKVNGEKLDLNKKYTLSSNSFILGGGDGYSMFSDCETVKTAIAVDNEALLKYIQDNLNGTIPHKYRASEGRMIKTDGKIDRDINITLLGFDNLTITAQIITFNEYLISLEKIKFEFPRQLKLNTNLSQKTRLRALQETEKEALCFIQNEVNETTAKYSCEIPNDNPGINTIIVQPNLINFDVQISPLANEYMSNLTKIKDDKELEAILNKENYVLQDATCKKNGNNIVISGNKDDIPPFIKNELTLIVYQLPENNRTNLSCTVEKGTENILCKAQPNVEYNLNSSILVDDDKILILNFAEKKEPDDTNVRKYFKKSSGLKPGILALIIIIPLVVVAAAIVGLILFLRKSPPTPIQQIPSISTSENIKGT